MTDPTPREIIASRYGVANAAEILAALTDAGYIIARRVHDGCSCSKGMVIPPEACPGVLIEAT